VLAISKLGGLNWSKVRALARDLTAFVPADEVTLVALSLLNASEPKRRMFAVYLHRFTSGAWHGNLAVLRERAAPDPDWEVQEALARPSTPTVPRPAMRLHCR
jgi:hypothetical protein